MCFIVIRMSSVKLVFYCWHYDVKIEIAHNMEQFFYAHKNPINLWVTIYAYTS